MTELFEHCAEALVANAELSAQVGASSRSNDESIEHVRGEVTVGSGVGVVVVRDLEVHVAGRVVSGEGEEERVWGGCGAVLDAECEGVAIAA